MWVGHGRAERILSDFQIEVMQSDTAPAGSPSLGLCLRITEQMEEHSQLEATELGRPHGKLHGDSNLREAS